MPAQPTSSPPSIETILGELLQSLSAARELVDVNIAAVIAAADLCVVSGAS